MFKLLRKFYEDKHIYKANPCDVDAHKFIAPFGRALAHFGSYCACCSGTRVLAAIALTAMYPIPVAVGAFLLYAVLVVKEIAFPSDN